VALIASFGLLHPQILSLDVVPFKGGRSNLDIGLWPLPSPPVGNPADFGSTIYLMLDDENTVDTDHDDMIVRMSVSAVPEPGTLALAILGAGSAALTVRRRRRKQKSRGEV
jgi:hypothetical protein